MLKKLVLWLVLLTAAFLAGFIPEYLRVRQSEQDISTLTDQVKRCQSGETLSEIASAAALMYLEATEKNYGNAGSYASRFFDQAQHLASTTQDQALQSQLRQILAARDQITADLAKGNEAVVLEIQPILAKVEQSTSH